jgi:putative heme iron utilization protein
MTLWPKKFSGELYAHILLTQNEDEDMFDVYVSNEEELESIAKAIERAHMCTVIRDGGGYITVCLPGADVPVN